MNCEYCMSDSGVLRVSKREGLEKDINICNECWKLLKDKKTALPLIRNHISMNLKGKVNPIVLDNTMNKFMDIISKWEPRN